MLTWQSLLKLCKEQTVSKDILSSIQINNLRVVQNSKKAVENKIVKRSKTKMPIRIISKRRVR
jgi:hypothetical protein